LYATVVLDRSTGIDRELTYGIPDALRETVQLGVAVAVPAGRQFGTGYVSGFTSTLDFEPAQLRAIAQVLSPPLFDAGALAVARWMSAYYHCTLSDALCCWIPQNAVAGAEKNYRFCADEPHRALNELTRAPKRLAIARFLWKNSPSSLKQIEKECGPAREALRFLIAAQIVAEEDAVTQAAVKVRRVLAVRAVAEPDWPALDRAAPRPAAALKEL
jgi:primosomal protein N' (replication factor Y)